MTTRAIEARRPSCIRHHAFLVVVLVATLISCDQDRGRSLPADPETDRAVIAVVLKDFAGWKGATFGNLEGLLELDSNSKANPDETPEEVKSLAPEISNELDKNLVAAFLQRNKSAAPVGSLISGSPWARLRQPASRDIEPPELPEGAKAIGSLTLPGLSENGARALIQIHHTWSIHGAVVTYVLSKEQGSWRVVARDQTVFL
jgi:hypothetical protein